MNKSTARLFLALLLIYCSAPLYAQKFALKSNLLYDLSTTFNLGAEFGLAPRWSLDLSASYNPWTFSDNRKMKHLLVQPEVRYWTCERFNGHFFGAHLLGGAFNVGGMSLPGLSNKFRYEGYTAGAGFTYGCQWMIGRQWNLETSLGLGYVHARYNIFDCVPCGKKLHSNRSKGFITPTKASISIIYIIK